MGSSPTKGVSVRAQKYVQGKNSEDIDQSSLPTPTSTFNGRIPPFKGGLRPNSAPNMPKKDEVDSGVSSGRHSITSFYNEIDNELYRKFFRDRNCADDDNGDDSINTGWDPSFEDLNISDKSDKCKSPKVLRKFNRDNLKNTQ